MKIRIIALCLVCTVICGLAFGCAHIDNVTASASVSANQELPSEAQTVPAASDQAPSAVSTALSFEAEYSAPQPVKLQAAEIRPASTQPAAAQPAAAQPAAAQPADAQSADAQPVKEQSRNKSAVSTNNVLIPQKTDFESLEKLVWNFRLYEQNYDCEKDSVLEVFDNRFLSDGVGYDPLGLEKNGVNCSSCCGLNMGNPEIDVFVPDPQHRFDWSGYDALREDLLIYYKEIVFNNYLPMEKEHSRNDGNEPSAYYENGWYYFQKGWCDNDNPCKCTSCTPTENGHYRISMDAIGCCLGDNDEYEECVDYIITIDAQLIEKDGLRLWKIFKITSESCW